MRDTVDHTPAFSRIGDPCRTCIWLRWYPYIPTQSEWYPAPGPVLLFAADDLPTGEGKSAPKPQSEPSEPNPEPQPGTDAPKPKADAPNAEGEQADPKDPSDDDPETPKNEQDEESKLRYDPDYIQTFPRVLTSKLFFGRKQLSLALSEPSGAEVGLESNSPWEAGLSMGWWWLGATVSVATSQGSEKYGDSDSFDFQWNYYGRRIHLEAWFFDYKGFYHEDESGNIEILDDVKVQGSALTFAYSFNPRHYSGAAAFKHTQRQLKTSGAAKVMASLSTMHVSSGATILPASVAPNFVEFQNLERINFLQAGVGGGYGYNYILPRNWYLHLGAAGAAGVNHYEYESLIDDDGTALFVRLDVDASIGWHTEEYFLGFDGGLDFFVSQVEDGDVGVVRNHIYVFVGFRY